MVSIEMIRSTGDYGFEIKDEMGHIINSDSSSKTGGNDSGFRPMQLLLAALGSCSAIDLVAILQKQKQTITGIKIIVEGEREENKIPSLWEKVNIRFFLTGQIEEDKANRAVALSIDKYCSVAETLRRGGTQIAWTLNFEPANQQQL